MDKQFEEMMRKKIELDRLKTEKEAIAFWHTKLLDIKNEQTLDAFQNKLNEIIKVMENRMRFLERESKRI